MKINDIEIGDRLELLLEDDTNEFYIKENMITVVSHRLDGTSLFRYDWRDMKAVIDARQKV